MIKVNPKLNPYLAGDNQKLGFLTSPVITKLWRLRLFLNRAISGMVADTHQTNPGSNPNPKTKNTMVTLWQQDATREEILTQVKESATSGDPLAERTTREIVNKIVIINPLTSPPTQIEIQGMPTEIDINPESSWAAVKSMGRNNPFMYYTGGEDTLSFDISWYSMDDDREDVITKCNLLKSWSKADGYDAAPPILFIAWGNSDMFQDDSFVLTSAPYQLSNFQNSYRNGPRRDSNSTIVDLKLLPNVARQQLTFKKVTAGNTTHAQIANPSKVSKASGIIIG